MAFIQDALNTLGDTLSGSTTVKSTTTSTQKPLEEGKSKLPMVIGIASGLVALVVVIIALKSRK